MATRGAYQRRDTKRITKAKQRERDKVAIDVIRGVRDACSAFYDSKDMRQPSVSKIIQGSVSEEGSKRFVSRARPNRATPHIVNTMHNAPNRD